MDEHGTKRSVLVSGGNRGIGLAIARAFAAEGDAVAVTYNASKPPNAEHEAPLLPVPCDVTDPTAIDRALVEVTDAHGPIQVLVNAAGITRDKPIISMSDEDWNTVLDTNLRGAGLIARRVAKAMLLKRVPYGRLIFISSVVGLRGEVGQANYAASKAGLIGLATSLARELGPRQITANVVMPGLIDTEMAAAMKPAARDALISAIPTRRMGRPDEVAALVRFLAGPDAGYCNGGTYPIDGGAATGH